ncbi:MAG TPA: hypothetical protein VFT39_12975 [Vicinamibacterales bacterium]|nr:hypothetical protein [Vicinamibacterales bacterium]
MARVSGLELEWALAQESAQASGRAPAPGPARVWAARALKRQRPPDRTELWWVQ